MIIDIEDYSDEVYNELIWNYTSIIYDNSLVTLEAFNKVAIKHMGVQIFDITFNDLAWFLDIIKNTCIHRLVELNEDEVNEYIEFIEQLLELTGEN